MKMTIYSYSRLGTYETCPLQYKLHYIDRITTEEEGIEAFMGTRIHETLEKLYKELILSKMNTIEELLEYYNENWDREWHDKIYIHTEGMKSEDYRKSGEKAIREYYGRYHPFDQGKTLWTEKMVQFDLGDENHKLRGVIDRLDKVSDGVFEIHDYKGSKNLPTQDRIDENDQLALYQLAVLKAYPDIEKVDLIWHFVLFDSELRSSRSKEQLEELKTRYRDLIDEVEAAQEFPANETALCDWCGYWEYCPCKKHLIEIEELPVEERKKEEGYEMVDRLDELETQRKLVKDEIEEVKEKIIEYAREKDLDVVRGSKKKAKVTIKTESMLPSKGMDEETYEEIIRLVKEGGAWEQVSQLNGKRLNKEFYSGGLPEDLRKELENYVVEEEVTGVRLKKLKEGEE
jgi:putative RecB family exonuclease